MDSSHLDVSDKYVDDGLSDSHSDAMSDVTAGEEGFHPSVQMQIQAAGLHINNFGRSDSSPIPVYRVSADGNHGPDPEYLSIRPSHRSNSAALVDATDPKQAAIFATVYRWGPRNPRIRLLPKGNSLNPEQAVDGEISGGEEWEVKGTGNPMSRSRRIVTSYGTFEWRYGSRTEKKEQQRANSLLVLDRVDGLSKQRTRVAQMIRNEELRTPGTSRWNTNGNGGRLQIDARLWDYKGSPDAKDMQAFVVASCICMLKREVDRQRSNQAALVT